MSKKERRARTRKRQEQGDYQPCDAARGKTSFPSAEEAIANLIRHGYAGLGHGIYECPHCGGFHRTSKPGDKLIREYSPTG